MRKKVALSVREVKSLESPKGEKERYGSSEENVPNYWQISKKWGEKKKENRMKIHL